VTSNSEAAEIFHNIADLLDVLGEKFKPEAYRRAARSIETLTEDLSRVAARNELRTIPGVGEAIEEKIREYLSSGQIPYYERLRREVPAGLVELMHLPGLGPKTARRFWTELGIEGPQELSEAIDRGRLDGVKGFGAKKIDQIRTALDARRAAPAGGSGRAPIETVYPLAERIVRALKAVPGTEQAEVAGSFRRRRESVGDLDILVTSKDAEKVFDAFSALPEVREVRLRGGTKETVILSTGLQVDLRVVEPASFGAALQYFTGSKDHNVRLRTIARDRGLKINEYGVFRGEERVAGRTEEEVYATLGLAWIPPELREDRGEIDQAAAGTLPRLVTAEDLSGELHAHLPEAATVADVDRLVKEARSRGLRYLGVVVGGSRPDGSSFALARPLLERLASGASKGLQVGRLVEAGGGPLSSDLRALPAEHRIVRPMPAAPGPETSVPTEPSPLLLAHLGGANGVPLEQLRRWIEWCARVGAAVEVGPGPERLDSSAARMAREANVPLGLPTGVGRPDDDPTMPIALGFARRAGATAPEVRTRPPSGEGPRRRASGPR
jgi:DNA polymerase/3'-5' exonuclease PolX